MRALVIALVVIAASTAHASQRPMPRETKPQSGPSNPQSVPFSKRKQTIYCFKAPCPQPKRPPIQCVTAPCKGPA